MKTKKQTGKRRITIKEVAQAAGVSIATVSYVLNNTPGQSISEDTRKKVFQTANLLGYECNVMAKYLASGKTNTVSVVFKNIPPFAAQYYMRFVTELSRVLRRKQLSLRITDYADELDHTQSPCDAYITVALTEPEFRAFADTKYVPVLAVDSMFDDWLFYRINDNYRALRDGAAKSANDKINFLTFELPRECLEEAQKHFDDVTVVKSVRDLAALDADKMYVTVSPFIYELCAQSNVRQEPASYAFKASAAADAVVKAIQRIQATSTEHDILV